MLTLHAVIPVHMGLRRTVKVVTPVIVSIEQVLSEFTLVSVLFRSISTDSFCVNFAFLAMLFIFALGLRPSLLGYTKS